MPAGRRWFSRAGTARVKGHALLSRSRLRAPAGSKDLYLDLHSSIRLRTIETVIIPFSRVGFRPVVRARPDKLTAIRASLPSDFCPVTFAWSAPRPDATTVYCTDDERTIPQTRGFGKIVLLDYQRSNRVHPDEFDVWFPLMMHPHIYLRGGEEVHGADSPEQGRPVRILFAGNYGEGYDLEAMEQLYGTPTRNELVAALGSLSSLRVVRNEHQWESALRAGYAGTVMFAPGFRVWQNRWVKTLAQADFFICPPGLLYPPCHNAFEAIAAATIPIICYPEWFVPALTHGQNCLVFRTPGEMLACIRTAMDLPSSEVARMRRNLVEYRERYLSPESVVQRILDFPDAIVRTRIVDEEQMQAALHIAF